MSERYNKIVRMPTEQTQKEMLMDFDRAHDKLVSFILSAMMTSALVTTAPQGFTSAAVAPNLNNVLASLRTPGWSGSDNLSVPTPPETPHSAIPNNKTTPPLSPVQLKKLEDFRAARGHDKAIGQSVANKLGLSTTSFRQLIIKDHPSGNLHVYIPLPDGGVLLSFLDDNAAYTYRLGSDFNVVASVAMTNAIPSEITSPETGAATELAYWIHVADQL